MSAVAAAHTMAPRRYIVWHKYREIDKFIAQIKRISVVIKLHFSDSKWHIS